MKTFFTTTKGKLIVGLVTVCAIAAIIVAVMMNNSGYRTIAVEALTGKTTIVNGGSTTEAYVGQHLKSGDDVTVEANSDLTLALDSDKFVYAKENTHFWIEAKGKEADSRTTINLDKGSTLCRVDNKLGENENFNVDTPNATMSVRGTVFKVECSEDANGDTYTVVDVLEGEVFVQVKMENGQNTEESRLLKVGERAIVRSNTDLSEFVKSDDSLEIDYASYSKEEAYFLGKAIDEGRNLSVTKELLYDVVGITEHDFSLKSEEVAATTEEEGYYYDICSVCGAQGEKHTIEKLKSETDIETENTKSEEDLKTDNNDESKDKKDVKKDSCEGGHTMEKKVVAATCTTEGYEENVCKVCGYKGESTKIKATGHTYTERTVDATCEAAGMKIYTCSKCGDSRSENISALGHSMSTTSTSSASCTSDGEEIQTCSRCGKSSTIVVEPALGHDFSIYRQDLTGGTDWYECSRCGAKDR